MPSDNDSVAERVASRLLADERTCGEISCDDCNERFAAAKQAIATVTAANAAKDAEITRLNGKLAFADRERESFHQLNETVGTVNQELKETLAAKDRLITALTEDNAKLANACDAKDDRIAELEGVVEKILGERDRYKELYEPFRPLSLEECTAVFDAQDECEPMSADRVEHGLKYVLDAEYRANYLSEQLTEKTRLVVAAKRSIAEAQTQLAAVEAERDGWKRQHDMILSQAQKDNLRAEDADRYELWLLEIGKLSGCGHVDDNIVRCIEQEFEKIAAERDEYRRKYIAAEQAATVAVQAQEIIRLTLQLQISGAEAMLDAIERAIPRNEAHRDYAETVQLFVEEAAVAAARKQHGASGMCCALREQEKRRADDLQAQLDRELTEALSLNNEMKALHDEACDERDALRAELTALKSQAIIDREKCTQNARELDEEIERLKGERDAGVSSEDPRCCDHGFVDKTPADWELLESQLATLRTACEAAKRELNCIIGQAAQRGETAGGPKRIVEQLTTALKGT